MRHPTLSLLLLAALALPACAGTTPVERHWGEAQRNATEAQIATGKGPDRAIDGQGAEAAYGNYSRALATSGAPAPVEPSFAILESD